MSENHDVTDQHAISASHAAQDADVAAHTDHPHVNYMAVFYALIGFTIISYLADVIGARMGVDPETQKTVKLAVGVVVLIIASFKAMAVMMYFMHLKFEGLWKFALLAPTIILAIALILSLMPDIAGDYYARVIPQTAAAAAEHHADASQGHGAAGSPHAVPEKVKH